MFSFFKSKEEDLDKTVKKKVKEINKMSVQDLIEELANSDDNPVKQDIIRKLIELKKEKIKQPKKVKPIRIKTIDKNIHKPVDTIINSNRDDLITELLDEIESVTSNPLDDILELIPNNRDSVDNHGNSRCSGNKDKGKDVDYFNNRMMDRLDNDVYLHTCKNKPNKKVFVSPFSEVDDGKYALFRSGK